MDHIPKRRSRLGSALTTAGGVLGVLGIIVMRIGLKATIVQDSHNVAHTHNVVLIRELVSAGGFVVFGIAIALIVAGSLVGRRATAQKDKGPVEASARTDPYSIPDFPPESAPTSPYDSSEKQPSGRQSSS